MSRHKAPYETDFIKANISSSKKTAVTTDYASLGTITLKTTVGELHLPSHTCVEFLTRLLKGLSA